MNALACRVPLACAMRSILAASVAVAVLIATVPAAAQQPVVITFSHVVGEDTPKGRAAVYFKKLVEERSRGRIKVAVHPDGRLYKDSDEMAALQKGQVQMLAPSLAKLSALGIPEFELFDLPYVFDNYAELHRITMGPIGRELLGKLQPKGIVGLAYWDNGFKQMSANKPLRKPEDVKGLRMRVQPSEVLQAQMRVLGANPVTMDFTATYEALKAGTVDGTENPASNFYTQQMQDVQKHMAVTYHGYIGYAVIVNRKFWDALSTDNRSVITGALRDATQFANDIASEANNDALAEIERSGKTQVVRLSPRERNEWKRALVGVHREMEGRIGKTLVQAVYAETGFDPAKP